jgi:hypothetical protein
MRPGMIAETFHATAIALTVGLAIGALGCGGSALGATSSDASANANGIDAGVTDGAASDGDDAATDAGAFPCGDAQCEPSQICFYPACGCLLLTKPVTDAGACPDGFDYWDAAEGSCFAPPNCMPPSCVSPDPGMGTLDCRGEDAGAACSLVNPPIPSGCNRTCHGICV